MMKVSIGQVQKTHDSGTVSQRNIYMTTFQGEGAITLYGVESQ